MPEPITYYLEPKQIAFLRADEDEVVYSGGYGGGKTLMVCLKAVLRAQHPRAVEVLCRANGRDVADTILPTLFEGSGSTPAILQPGTYAWNKAESSVRLISPDGAPLGLIRYRGLGAVQQSNLDRMRFRGQNVTGVGIDQLEEIGVKQYNNVLGRVRVMDAGLTRQVYGSANPSAPSHWIAQRFGIKSSHVPTSSPYIRTEQHVGGKKIRLLAVMTSPAENPHLPADYLARLATFAGVERDRYVLGKWVASEGVVYDNFVRALHVVDREGPWSRLLIGVDDGTTVPAALLLCGVDTDGNRHYFEELHRPGMSNGEKVARCLYWQHRYGTIEAVVVDPAASGLKLDLSRAGLPVFNGKNERKPGIGVVRSALEPGPGGKPGWTIAPRCENTIGEIEGYLWDKNASDEAPVKKNDHGPDAIRYVEMHLHAPPSVVFIIPPEVEARARAERVTWRGTLTHTHPAGREQDLSLASGRLEDIELEAEKDGPLTLWIPAKRDIRRRYMISVSASRGDTSKPSHAVIADIGRKQIVGQFVAAMPPERFARAVGMLALWFSNDETQATVIAYTNSTGRVTMQHLGRLGFGVESWEPSGKDFAEAVGSLRAAWESRQINEPDPAALATARQYVYAGETVMHGGLVGTSDARASHADAVVARTLLWHRLSASGFDDIQEPDPPPGTLAYVRKMQALREKQMEWRA